MRIDFKYLRIDFKIIAVFSNKFYEKMSWSIPHILHISHPLTHALPRWLSARSSSLCSWSFLTRSDLPGSAPWCWRCSLDCVHILYWSGQFLVKCHMSSSCISLHEFDIFSQVLVYSDSCMPFNTCDLSSY